MTFDNVIYNSTQSKWQCCGGDLNSGPTCQDASSETFDAPSPKALLSSTLPILLAYPSTVQYSTATTSSTAAAVYTTTATMTVTQLQTKSVMGTGTDAATAAGASSTGPSVSQHNSNSGLSAGAGAGIGIGVTLALAAIAFVAWILWQRRSRSNSKHMDNNSTDKTENMSGPHPAEAPVTHTRSNSKIGNTVEKDQNMQNMYGGHPIGHTPGGPQRPELGTERTHELSLDGSGRQEMGA